MSQTIDRVKQKQGIISKIQDIFTLGYSTKEDLRELDKKLRDNYYADFKSHAPRWEEIYFEALNAKTAKWRRLQESHTGHGPSSRKNQQSRLRLRRANGPQRAHKRKRTRQKSSTTTRPWATTSKA